MALGPRLDLRQAQSLVMTPQLQQAIKLLALSNLEIESFVGEALDANPLLELAEREPSPVDSESTPDEELRRTTLDTSPVDQLVDEGRGEEDRPLDIDTAALDRDRETGAPEFEGAPLTSSAGEAPALEERSAATETLAEHLHAQIGAVVRDPQQLFIARWLIDQLDESGYLRSPLERIADELGIPEAQAETALTLVQQLDPTGVGARNLGECLALQAKEADRLDPMMALLLDNLDLLGRGEIARLKRLCGADDEDFAEMLAELRSYDPKPGLRFGAEPAEAIVPDILVRAAGNGWDITLNPATLPRLVINRSYYLELRHSCDGKQAKAWLGEKLADANWLIKALDQRQRTILTVAGEIVKQQEGFFRKGVAELRPLTLRAVADAVGLHESTVSRVTSNKYLNCSRGTFELKYFFSSGVAAADGDGAISAEAVKARIRALIDAEDPKAVLSDDALVDLLKQSGFDLARRTVAKYREAIGLGSSVQRRRQKALAAVR